MIKALAIVAVCASVISLFEGRYPFFVCSFSPQRRPLSRSSIVSPTLMHAHRDDYNRPPAWKSRREWIGQCIMTVAVVSMPLSSAATNTESLPVKRANFTSSDSQFEPMQTRQTAKSVGKSSSNSSSAATTSTETPFKSVNLTAVAQENTINVTAYQTGVNNEKKAAVFVDRKDFTIVTVKKDLPKWFPKEWRPRQKITIPNEQLLASAIVAGSITEVVRTAVLYPLSTVKTRIQANPTNRSGRTWKRRIQALYISLLRATRQGDLFAGLGTSLAVTVPAAGVYYGVRDVSNRLLSGPLGNISPFASIEIALLSAFAADVISVALRTPADVYILRRQVAQMMPNSTSFGWEDSIRDGVSVLPAAIVTDLPYLLLRLFGSWLITQGNEGLVTYEFETVIVACLVATLTTPFDVARTRIFVNNFASEDTGHDDDRVYNDRRSVLRTMQNITKENDAGVQNLYAGWVERAAFFGLGRAWFDPIRVIGYLGIRDAILIKFFLK